MNKIIIGALCLISMSSLGFCDGELNFDLGTGPLKAPGMTKSEPVLRKAVKTAPAKKQAQPKKEENKTVTKTVLGQVGVVKSKVANIYKNPSHTSGKYFEAPSGMRLVVVKESGNWVGVRMGEAAKGALGWVDKKNLTFTGELVTEVTEVR
ncbi:MAG: SH3 domain-containing protein, partial [Abditibacteriota bacterium]|nr:SH3 domain-containing protein [Abditibacteriota bacterium]